MAVVWSSRVLSRVVIPFGLAFATVTCFGATEVSVVISTDLDCSARLHTNIRIGDAPRYGDGPVADTSMCDPAGTDHRIGSLTVTPSGSRDARLGIKVTLARNGKSPDQCTAAAPEDCIVATRSFRFISHSSRSLPIRLSADCVGVTCKDPATETCLHGQCVSNDAETFVDQPAEASLDGAVRDAEAGTKDADADAGPVACMGPAHDGILWAMPKAPDFLRGSSSDTLDWLYRLGPDGMSGEHSWFPKDPAVGEVPTKEMLQPSIEFFDVDGSIISYVYSLGVGKLNFASRTNGGTFALAPTQLTFSPNDLTFDLNGNLYFAADSKIYWNAVGGQQQVLFDAARGGSQIVASEKFLYLLNGATVTTVPLDPGNAQSDTLKGPPFARLASNRRHAFASSSSPMAKIYRFDDGGPVAATTYQAIADVDSDPIALAVDPDHVYWIDNGAGSAAIMKSVYAPTVGVAPTTVVAGYSELAGLVVDQRVGGCVYFWGSDASNVAALHVAPKGP